MPQLKASDYITNALDEVGTALARTRAEWLTASGERRIELKQAYDDLLKRLQQLMFRDLKQIDEDPRIKQAITELQNQAELITKARREMTSATKAVKNAQKIIGYVDRILGIVADVGLV